MEPLSRYLLRLGMVIGCLLAGGLFVAVAGAVVLGETSVMDLGQAAFYVGIAMACVGMFLAMPFQGVGGGGAGSAGLGDFLRIMTLTANVTDWEALHKRDREHTRRAMPAAFCLGGAGLVLTVAGVAVTWVAWNGSAA